MRTDPEPDEAAGPDHAAQPRRRSCGSSQDGAEIHPARFLEDAVSRRGQGLRIANMSRLSRLLDEGCTVVLDQVDFFDPTMEVACRALQWWARETVQVNTYLTTQATDGFPLHWHDADVLVVQLAGSKSWEVRGQSRNAPDVPRRCPQLLPAYRRAVVRHAGSRAGDAHSARLLAPRNPRRPRRGLQPARNLRHREADRRALAELGCRPGARRREPATRPATGQHCAEQDRRLSGAGGYRPRLHRQLPIEHFRQARELQDRTGTCANNLFGRPGAVACIYGLPADICCQHGVATVTAAGKRLQFAGAALPALRRLLSGAPVEMATIEEDTGLDLTRVVDVLIEEGLCCDLTAELRSGYTGLVTTAGYFRAPLPLASAS